MQSIGAAVSICLRWVVIPGLFAGVIVLCWAHGSIYLLSEALDQAQARNVSCVSRLLEAQARLDQATAAAMADHGFDFEGHK